ncbi:hypothetical protein HIM_09217 [Hirsutella minnesotensis 3608]|uniref:Aminoglycoside phosphotransferase domain-containing protein n=1 Tax=Hirsutella minnesotensis 3608 TaxID=1043627 RepID=A0A0F7ZGS0_9HYPO|nr:hypothetical protein HIM_09217 [Hirsutella minnesotensis 3608]
MAYENKENFKRRMTVVEDIIQKIGLKSIEVTPLRWNENQVHPFNNFIFKVKLSSPAFARDFPETARQPYTDPLPWNGVSVVIVRLSNPRALSLNNSNRVETEVAAIQLLRTALTKLGPYYASLVPIVYAWKAAQKPEPIDESGFGWTVMEYLPGLPLNKACESFDMAEKECIVSEIATIFSAMQGMELPPGVDRYGGFTIDDQGNILSGQETIVAVPGGPWSDYDDYWRHQLFCQLIEADSNSIIQGWRAHGIRERVDTFMREKLRDIINNAGLNLTKLAFVHADFTMSNMLYDHEKKCISGIVDFDWAGATHPGHEFFNSLYDVYGTTIEQGSEKLRQAILTSDFCASVDPSEEKHAEAWKLAQVWDEAVKESGGLRLSDINGMQTLLKLNTLTDTLNPYYLNGTGFANERTAEQNVKARADAEKVIHEILCSWGI